LVNNLQNPTVNNESFLFRNIAKYKDGIDSWERQRKTWKKQGKTEKRLDIKIPGHITQGAETTGQGQ
jgi:hypothetical protein